MTTFILIWVITGTPSTTTHSQEFSSKQNCEAAAEKIKTVNTYGFTGRVYVWCMEK